MRNNDNVTPTHAGSLTVLVALFGAALALRPQLVGVGPLLPAIQDDLGLSHAVSGTLPAIPVLCMGVLAASAGAVLRRAHAGRAVGASLLGIAVFGALRSAVPNAEWLIAMTVPVGAATGLGLALMPVIVKQTFPERPVFATGIYTTGLNVGSTASALLAAPLATGAHGWRAALLAFSLATGLLIAVWLVTGAHRIGLDRGAASGSPKQVVGAAARQPVVWLLIALFSTMGIVFYGLTSWIPDIYVEHGWTAASAGALVAALTAIAAPASLVVPWLADRHGSRRVYLVGSSSAMLVACCGIAVAPDLGWLWAACAGIGIGVLFPVLMTLPLDLARHPSETAAIAGVVLGVGYSVAALTPTGLGAVRDLTGSFETSVVVLAIVAAAMVVLSTLCSPARLSAPR